MAAVIHPAEPPPTITISSPSFVGVGTYQYNEIVTGTMSGVTARVRSWNYSTSTLEISNVTGTFTKGETIVGSASSAVYTLSSIVEEDIKDAYADNLSIETEADKILDFTEINPFGMP